MCDIRLKNNFLALSAGDISCSTLLVCESCSDGTVVISSCIVYIKEYTALFAGGIEIIEPSCFTMLLSCEAKEEKYRSQMGYSEFNLMFKRLSHSTIVGRREGI